MSASLAPDPTDPAIQLPFQTYYQVIHTLRLTLPPPLSDSPEDLVRRDHAAIARIAGLCPANAAEADVAALFVAASEQWKDCLRLVQDPAAPPETVPKCRAQALAMMRQSQSALRLLLRMQADRRKTEADNTTRDRAAWAEHCATGLMMQALRPATLRPTPAEAVQPAPEPPPANPSPAHPPPATEPHAPITPQRTALIRRLGRVPETRTAVSPHDPPSRTPGNETAGHSTAAPRPIRPPQQLAVA